MSEIEERILPLMKNIIGGLDTENIVMDAAQDLVKDEIKKYIRQKLDERPELKQEIKQGVEDYFEAKVKGYIATIKLAKTMAKLGIHVVPEHLRAELTKEITEIFEKEIGQIIERTI